MTPFKVDLMREGTLEGFMEKWVLLLCLRRLQGLGNQGVGWLYNMYFANNNVPFCSDVDNKADATRRVSSVTSDADQRTC